MECISVFDMLKIGVGPSSSHTLGPWRAAERWIAELEEQEVFNQVKHIKAYLYGSLSLTGKGHATDIAVVMGLLGTDPETVDIDSISGSVDRIKTENKLNFGGKREVPFSFVNDIIFKKEFLPFHANGIQFEAELTNGESITETYYSIGGGFVVKEELTHAKENKETFKTFPHPVKTGNELLEHCNAQSKSISKIVMENSPI